MALVNRYNSRLSKAYMVMESAINSQMSSGELVGFLRQEMNRDGLLFPTSVEQTWISFVLARLIMLSCQDLTSLVHPVQERSYSSASNMSK